MQVATSNTAHNAAVPREGTATPLHLALISPTVGSGGYRKFLRRIVPLLRRHRAVAAITVVETHRGSSFATSDGASASAAGSALAPLTVVRCREWTLAATLARLGVDLALVLAARALGTGSVPQAMIVQNMEPLLCPYGANPWREQLKNFLRLFELRRAVQRTDRVIAVSPFTRDVLEARYPSARGKVGVVPRGFDTEPPLPHPPHAPPTFPFLFTLGSIRPARGLEDALHALATLRTEQPELRLIIGGAVDPFMSRYAARLSQLCRTLGIADAVEWRGPLTPEVSSWFMARCHAFLMTSRAEACPNTFLEALRAGCPVVSVASRPMTDLGAGRSLFYPAGDSAALAAQVSAIGSAAPQSASSVSLPSWEDVAELLIGELREVLRG